MTRRTLLGASLGMGAMLLAGCSRFGLGGGGSAQASLNMIWWGDAALAEKTEAMLDLFLADRPGLEITTEFQDSGPYADKMATRFAAGDVPDVFNQRPDTIREYIDRGALLDLSRHADALDLGDVGDAIPLARVGDGVFGVPCGTNAVGIAADTASAAAFGVDVPDGDAWAWDDLWAFSKEIAEASGGQVYGVELGFGTMQNLAVFVRQRGEEYFDADGRFGASEETLSDWFAMSADQRAAGALPPAGFIETTGGSPAQSAIVEGLVVARALPSNTFAAYADLLGDALTLLRFPGEVQGDRRGLVVTPSMYWSIGERSPHRDEALDLLDFIVNDVDGNLETGTARGVPIADTTAGAVFDAAGEADRTSIEYIRGLLAEDLPAYVLDPSGAPAVADVLAEVDIEVMFGRLGPREAAARLREEAVERMGVSA